MPLAVTILDHLDIGATQLAVAAGFALALAVLAWIGRDVLPAGLGPGLVVGSVSSFAFVAAVAVSDARPPTFTLLHVFAGLTILWTAACLPSAHQSAHRSVFGAAAIACGGAVVALAFVLLAGDPVEWGVAALADLGLLLLITLVVWRHLRTADIAMLALLAATALALAVLPSTWRELGPLSSFLPFALAAVILLWTAAILIAQWLHRSAAWLQSPAMLIDSPTPYPLQYALLSLLGLGCAVFALIARLTILTPLTLALASLTLVTVGHLAKWRPISTAGLAAAAGAVATLTYWLAPGNAALMLGLALAGGWCVWLAAFWQQQLLDGIPWTTTGRMIPGARRLGLAFSFAIPVIYACLLLTADLPATRYAFGSVLCVVLMLLALLHVRDSAGAGTTTSAWAAALVMIVAVHFAGALLERSGAFALYPRLTLGTAALLLALRVLLAQGLQARHAAYCAVIAGVLPTILLMTVTLTTPSVYGWTGLGLSFIAALLVARPAAARQQLQKA